jgi:hypothetical protein
MMMSMSTTCPTISAKLMMPALRLAGCSGQPWL